MMKRINIIGTAAMLLTSSVAILNIGCSDEFLKEKDAGAFTDQLYNDYEGAKGRVDFLYANSLPTDGGSTFNFTWFSTGSADDYSKSTEEYAGLSTYVDPSVMLNNTNVPDYIFGENKNTAPYGRIRECNEVINGITKGQFDEVRKPQLLGQAYFFRAWCYYRLVKIYGGVPLVKEVQAPISQNSSELIIPRSTTKECIDFICEDLEKAASMLPAQWTGNDWGRITSGTAQALEGRARLLYASPLFNRAVESDPNSVERWKEAYDTNKAALATLDGTGFYGLAGEKYAGTSINGSKWAKMFSDIHSPEAVFVTLYNNVGTTTGTNYDKNNGWENSIRPINVGGGGGKETTEQMIDLFPMADGLKPSESTTYPYGNKPNTFFLNRDPRFYRTFAFPGVRWDAQADLGAKHSSNPNDFPYSSGNDYTLWDYAWYKSGSANLNDGAQTGWAADGLGNGKAYIYIRKRTDDLQLNSSPLYVTDKDEKTGDIKSWFKRSAAPYMEMRYAEVLLNFAESACGYDKPDEAIAAIKRIRVSAGYSEDAAQAYASHLATLDKGHLFGAILYERQIELAYEGKRFDDMRRWMLWDGGVGQENLKSSWKLQCCNGNTCTYLGVLPLNGQRRTGVEMQTSQGADEKNGSDPIKQFRPTAGLDLMKDAVVEDETDATKPANVLAQFYNSYLQRKVLTTKDGTDQTLTIDFLPQYYILGFKVNMQQNNSTLRQTVGWADYMNGGANGTFDPLAE
jgi:hypothetical protein